MQRWIGLFIALGALSLGVTSASAAPKDSVAVQKECADYANSCLRGCYSGVSSGAPAMRRCEDGCKDKYKICINIEMEAEARPAAGTRQPYRAPLEAAPATGGAVAAPPAGGNQVPFGTIQLFQKQ